LKLVQANSLKDPILKKPYHKKIGLVEWLKVKALSLSPSTAKTKTNPAFPESKKLQAICATCTVGWS
jgi:hypothetical protein